MILEDIIDRLESMLEDKIHHEDDERDDHRSDHNDPGAGEEFLPRGPRGLIDKLVINVLAVIYDFFH